MLLSRHTSKCRWKSQDSQGKFGPDVRRRSICPYFAHLACKLDSLGCIELNSCPRGEIHSPHVPTHLFMCPDSPAVAFRRSTERGHPPAPVTMADARGSPFPGRSPQSRTWCERATSLVATKLGQPWPWCTVLPQPLTHSARIAPATPASPASRLCVATSPVRSIAPRGL